MRIRKPGKIRDHLWFLGTEESCVYLLEGKSRSLLISGGLSYLVPEILRQFQAFRIDAGRISNLLILHSHFDHIGIVPFLKRRDPGLEILASPRAWDILGMTKAIRTVNDFNRLVAKRMNREEVYRAYDLDWREEITGTSLKEGDTVDLGGLGIRILETPGHSSCSITAYVPEIKALFASDAGGIPYKETLLASGNSNFTQFQQSLEKLRGLEVEYACADHYGSIVGQEAGRFIQDTIEAAGRERAFIEEVYRKTGDISSAARTLTADYFETCPDWVVSPEIVEGVYRQIVRHIAAALTSL